MAFPIMSKKSRDIANFDLTKAVRRPQTRAKVTRQRLVLAAIDILSTQGYAATTMSQVAKVAGVSSGPRQYHFPEPVRLFGAVVDYINQDWRGEYVGSGRDSDPVAAVAEQLHIAFNGVGSRSHLAMLELKLASRGDPLLRAEIGPKIRAFEDQSDIAFASIVGQTGMSDAQIIALRTIIVGTLRGVAIAGLERDQTDIIATVAELLPQMIGDLIRRVGGGNGPKKV